MKKHRELFETELAEIRDELLRLAACSGESPTDLAATASEEQAATPPTLTGAAFELAGYVVATRALGRSIPDKVALEVREYDLGTCSESELETIWAVGHLAGERSRSYGCSGEQGLIGISVTLETSNSDGMEPPEVIVNESWDTIVRIARLLIERGELSRSELENGIFGPGVEAKMGPDEGEHQAAATHKEPLEDWGRPSDYWLHLTQSEMALWADLVSKVVSARSVPQTFEAYAECLSQQMKMTAEHAQHLLNVWRHVIQTNAEV